MNRNNMEMGISSCRVSRVEIRSGDAIDQIKFIFTDDSEWAVGHEGGKLNNSPAIMSKG